MRQHLHSHLLQSANTCSSSANKQYFESTLVQRIFFSALCNLFALSRSALRCCWNARGQWRVMAALNFLADGASRRILFLSFICENFTTISGARSSRQLFRDSTADTLSGRQCTFKNCIFRVSVRNERTIGVPYVFLHFFSWRFSVSWMWLCNILILFSWSAIVLYASSRLFNFADSKLHVLFQRCIETINVYK